MIFCYKNLHSNSVGYTYKYKPVVRLLRQTCSYIHNRGILRLSADKISTCVAQKNRNDRI